MAPPNKKDVYRFKNSARFDSLDAIQAHLTANGTQRLSQDNPRTLPEIFDGNCIIVERTSGPLPGLFAYFVGADGYVENIRAAMNHRDSLDSLTAFLRSPHFSQKKIDLLCQNDMPVYLDIFSGPVDKFRAMNAHFMTLFTPWILAETARRLDQIASVDAVDQDGFTPLTYASLHGYTDCVELILERGADIDKLDRHGNTALVNACHSGSLACVQTLLARGADVNAPSNPDGPDGISYSWSSGITPLWVAASRSPEILEALIHAGANLEQVVLSGETALTRAAATNNERCAQVLAEHGANIEPLKTRYPAMYRLLLPILEARALKDVTARAARNDVHSDLGL